MSGQSIYAEEHRMVPHSISERTEREDQSRGHLRGEDLYRIDP